MRFRTIPLATLALPLCLALAAPPVAAGKLDSVTQAAKDLIEQPAAKPAAPAHAQGAAALLHGKSGNLGKARNLLGKGKLDLLKGKKD